MPLDEYVRKNFYDKLGMYSTGFKPRNRFQLECLVPTETEKHFRQQTTRGDVHDEEDGHRRPGTRLRRRLAPARAAHRLGKLAAGRPDLADHGPGPRRPVHLIRVHVGLRQADRELRIQVRGEPGAAPGARLLLHGRRSWPRGSRQGERPENLRVVRHRAGDRSRLTSVRDINTLAGPQPEDRCLVIDGFDRFFEAVREHGSYQLMHQEMDFNGSPKQVQLPGGVEIASATLDYHKIAR